MKIRRFLNMSTLVLATMLTVPITVVVRPLAAQPADTYQMISIVSNNCLQPINQSMAAGAAIVQETCSTDVTDLAQRWTIVPVQWPYVHLVNWLSGMCLDARGGAKNYTPAQQWPCNSITNENWVYSPVGLSQKVPVYIYAGVSGSYNSDSRFCLDVPGGKKTSVLPVQIGRAHV